MKTLKVEVGGETFEFKRDGSDTEALKKLATRLDPLLAGFSTLSHLDCMKSTAPVVKKALLGEAIPPTTMGFHYRHTLEHYNDCVEEETESWQNYWDHMCWSSFSSLVALSFIYAARSEDPEGAETKWEDSFPILFPSIAEAVVILEYARSNPEVYHWNCRVHDPFESGVMKYYLELKQLIDQKDESVKSLLKSLLA